MSHATASGTSPSSGSPAATRARMSVEAAGFGSISKKLTRSGRSSCSSTASRSVRGKPGRVATASRVRPSTSAGSFQARKCRNWSAPITKTGSSKRSARRSSTVRGWRSRRTSSAGKEARASATRPSTDAGTSRCPGRSLTRTTSRSTPKRSLAASATATWPTCGGSKAPPYRTGTGDLFADGRRGERAEGERPLVPLEQVLPQLDFVARPCAGRLEDHFELFFRGRLTDDAEAALGAVDAEGAACRARAVDEKVDHLVRSFDRLFDLWRGVLKEGAAQLVEARAGRGGDSEDAEDPLVLDVEGRRLGTEVDLVQDDDLWTLVEPGSIGGELRVDRAPALVGVVLGRVDHVHEHPGALQVSEELVAEPGPIARTLDQPGDVAEDQLANVRGLHGPEHRRELREWILGTLRPRIREPRQERRLACVGEADERGVREQLEAELDLPFLAGQADLGEARRLPARPCEMLVAAAAHAAFRHDDSGTRVREVGDELLALEDLRPDRDGEHRVVSARAVGQTAAAATAATRAQLLVPPEAREVAPPRVGHEHDVAALAAVSPVGTATRHVLLAPEVDRAVTAAARDDCQSCAIVEHLAKRKVAAWRTRSQSRSSAASPRPSSPVSCSAPRKSRATTAPPASRPAPETVSSRSGRRARSSSVLRTPGVLASSLRIPRSARPRRSGALRSSGMRPCRCASRRSCRPGRSRRPGRDGSACRAGGRGSSPPSRPGRRRASRRASSGSSRALSVTSRVPSCAPSTSSPRVPIRAPRARPCVPCRSARARAPPRPARDSSRPPPPRAARSSSTRIPPAAARPASALPSPPA